MAFRQRSDELRGISRRKNFPVEVHGADEIIPSRAAGEYP